MSSLWTPSGEQPIRPESPASGPASPPGAGAPPGAAGGRPPPGGTEPSEEEIRAELAEISRQLLQTPASVVVANHCIGLFQLAALHLDQEPPNLAEARVAIDALGAIVETLGNRLGQEEGPLRDALHQLRVAFVGAQQAAKDSGSGEADPPGEAG